MPVGDGTPSAANSTWRTRCPTQVSFTNSRTSSSRARRCADLFLFYLFFFHHHNTFVSCLFLDPSQRLENLMVVTHNTKSKCDTKRLSDTRATERSVGERLSPLNVDRPLFLGTLDPDPLSATSSFPHASACRNIGKLDAPGFKPNHSTDICQRAAETECNRAANQYTRHDH